MEAFAGQPNMRRWVCSTVARGPVLALTPTPTVACCSRDSTTRTRTGAAAALAGSGSKATVTLLNSRVFCSRSWYCTSWASVSGVPGPKPARARTMLASWCCRPVTVTGPARNSGPLSSTTVSAAVRASGSTLASLRTRLAAA